MGELLQEPTRWSSARVPQQSIVPNGYVDGNFRKSFSAAGAKTFEVGTANGYSPVTVNVTSGTFPADFTVKATQGPLPAIPNPAAALQRYWTLAATGMTADLTFNYLDPTDIPMTVNENSFVIFKYDGTLTMPGGSVNTTGNTATITGVSSFSDWTLAAPPPVVSNINDSGAGSLRQAVADAVTGVTISFDLGTGAHTVTLGSEVIIDKNLIINGPTDSAVTISGGDVTRILSVSDGNTAVLSNLTIANGSAVGNGGGIANNGDLTLFNCTLSGNEATAHGGAIWNNGTLKMTNSTLSDNHATSGTADGGAINNVLGLGHVAILGNVTLVNNTAGRNGGGITSGGMLNLKRALSR